METFGNDQSVFEPSSGWEKLQQDYIAGQRAIEELEVAKQVLAFAISKLPKQQLKLTVTEQTKLHELGLQQKLETKSGAILFRAVKV